MTLIGSRNPRDPYKGSPVKPSAFRNSNASRPAITTRVIPSRAEPPRRTPPVRLDKN